MNKIDLIIFLIILGFMFFGYYKGLVKSILNVVQYFAIIILVIYLSPVISRVLIEKFDLDLIIIEWVNNNEKLFSNTLNIINEEILKNIVGRIVNVISAILLFVILKIVFSLIISILNKITELPILNLLNKLGGVLLGTFNGFLVVYLLILLINWVPLEAFNLLRLSLESSKFGNIVNELVPEVATEVISIVKISI